MLNLLILLASVLQFTDALLTFPPPSEGRAIKRLKSSLLCDYDNMERPVKRQENNITVSFYLSFQHASFVGFESKVLITAYIYMDWHDEFLQWEPENFQNISKMSLEPQQIWFPQIRTSGVLRLQDLKRGTAECMVKNSGLVTCAPFIATEFHCLQNLLHWPFDQQLCDFNFTSSTFLKECVIFQQHQQYGGFSIFLMGENNEWKVLNISSKSYLNVDNTCWSLLSYTIKMERHASLYAITIVAQAFVTAAITLLSFWASEFIIRINLCCAALLGNCLCLLYIGTKISSSGTTTPNIAVFFRDSMIMTLISLAVGFCVESLKNKSINMRAPTWLISCTSCLDKRGGRMGQLLLGDLDPEKTPGNDEDESSTTTQCSSFTTFLDRLTFLTLLIIYSIMLAALLP